MTCTSGQRHSGVKILNALNVSLDWGNAPVCCLHWRRARSGCWLLWWADPSRCARCSGWHRAVAFPTAGQLSGPPGPLSPRGRPYQDLRRQEISHYSEVIVTFFHVDVEQDETCCLSKGGTIQHVKQTDMCWTSDESLFTISFLLTNYLHNKRLDFTVPRGEPGPCVTFSVGNTVNVSRFQPCLIQRFLEDSQNDSAVMPGCVTGQEPLKWYCTW